MGVLGGLEDAQLGQGGQGAREVQDAPGGLAHAQRREELAHLGLVVVEEEVGMGGDGGLEVVGEVVVDVEAEREGWGLDDFCAVMVREVEGEVLVVVYIDKDIIQEGETGRVRLRNECIDDARIQQYILDTA